MKDWSGYPNTIVIPLIWKFFKQEKGGLVGKERRRRGRERQKWMRHKHYFRLLSSQNYLVSSIWCLFFCVVAALSWLSVRSCWKCFPPQWEEVEVKGQDLIGLLWADVTRTLSGLQTTLIACVFIMKSADLGLGLLQHTAEVLCVMLYEIAKQRIPKAQGNGKITKRSPCGGPAPIV